MRTHLLRLSLVAAQLSAAVVAAVLVPGSAPASPVPHPVFLITGDRLAAGNVVIPPSRQRGALLTIGAYGTYDIVPAAAVPYLGHGLAPSLFDVAMLRAAEAAGRLPVRVSYRGRLRCCLACGSSGPPRAPPRAT